MIYFNVQAFLDRMLNILCKSQEGSITIASEVVVSAKIYVKLAIWPTGICITFISDYNTFFCYLRYSYTFNKNRTRVFLVIQQADLHSMESNGSICFNTIVR